MRKQHKTTGEAPYPKTRQLVWNEDNGKSFVPMGDLLFLIRFKSPKPQLRTVFLWAIRELSSQQELCCSASKNSVGAELKASHSWGWVSMRLRARIICACLGCTPLNVNLHGWGLGVCRFCSSPGLLRARWPESQDHGQSQRPHSRAALVLEGRGAPTSHTPKVSCRGHGKGVSGFHSCPWPSLPHLP